MSSVMQVIGILVILKFGVLGAILIAGLLFGAI